MVHFCFLCDHPEGCAIFEPKPQLDREECHRLVKKYDDFDDELIDRCFNAVLKRVSCHTKLGFGGCPDINRALLDGKIDNMGMVL
jgi:hypothetical protein